MAMSRLELEQSILFGIRRILTTASFWISVDSYLLVVVISVGLK